ncbi:MAG TPA: RDD family protein [Candidatus Limnocylindrales bacterium]|nr:RDD family protein [Candidatus Limnocylindrales bacterium]
MSSPSPGPGAGSPQVPPASPYQQAGRPVWPALAPNGQPLASFTDRLLAYLIDYAIYFGVSLILTVPFTIWMSITVFRQMERAQAAEDFDTIFGFVLKVMLYSLALAAVAMLYTYIYWVEIQRRWGGQTVGKRVMDIRVIPVMPGAPELSRGAYALRWAIQFVVGGLIPFFNLLDGLWQLWDKPLQQCLHDKAAKTVVVKVG